MQDGARDESGRPDQDDAISTFPLAFPPMRLISTFCNLKTNTGVQNGARHKSGRPDQDDAPDYLHLLDFHLHLLGKPHVQWFRGGLVLETHRFCMVQGSGFRTQDAELRAEFWGFEILECTDAALHTAPITSSRLEHESGGTDLRLLYLYLHLLGKNFSLYTFFFFVMTLESRVK